MCEEGRDRRSEIGKRWNGQRIGLPLVDHVLYPFVFFYSIFAVSSFRSIAEQSERLSSETTRFHSFPMSFRDWISGSKNYNLSEPPTNGAYVIVVRIAWR